MDTIQITDIKIKTTVDEDYQSGSLEVVIRAEAGMPAFLCAQLLNLDGQEEDRIFPVPVEAEMDFCMQVSPVCLWNAEDVYLYDLVLELRDEKMQLLGSTVKKIAFRRWEIKNDVRMLNGHAIKRRMIRLPLGWKKFEEDKLCAWLCKTKRAHYNTVVTDLEKADNLLWELCLEYGLYLEDEKEAVKWEEADFSQETGMHPDYELNVTQEGVLIENHCSFANVAQYELRYSLRDAAGARFGGSVEADVPPGASRYIELPFARPKSAGECTYRAALCQKRETLWAESGEEIVFAQTVISNFYQENKF